MKKGDLIDLTIEKMVYGGEGIGKIDGITVFVEDVAPDDVIKAEIVSIKKTYAKAVLKEIIVPSKCRLTPVCGLAKTCGGCQWQHISYESQIKFKKQIVEETLKKLAGIDIAVNDVLKSEPNFEYRCKVQYPISQTKNSKRFLAGYFKSGTHEIINIKKCYIQPDLINEITEFFRQKAQLLGLTGYNEKAHAGLIRHLVFRIDKTHSKILLAIVLNTKTVPPAIKELAKSMCEEFKQIKGVIANFNDKKTNLIMSMDNELVLGDEFIVEELKGRKFKISAGSFFQVNPDSAVKMFDTAREMILKVSKTPSILDIYAGVGSFSLWMKDIASGITAIEEYPNAVKDAYENIELNENIQGADIKYIQGDASIVMQDIAGKNEKYDVIIVDPPRKGCTEEVLNSIAQINSDYIIYVSCNPSTLARDLKILKTKSFEPQEVQPVDMFCHTYHIETIVLIKNTNK